MIPFNKPFLTGHETEYIFKAVQLGKISGNGFYTESCHQFFQNNFGFRKCLLTTSCTDALEMAAILLDIKPEDEVIVPSYTFVSTANAFILRGAKIRFIDSGKDHPNLDVDRIEELINPKTRAIVVVHYAGVACDMDRILAISEKHKLFVVEDAAQAIDSFYKGKRLGSLGHLAAFSFHETKNVISGEGGMLVVNDPQFEKRADIIWEKGTNRKAFFKGEVSKYGWIDIGSSFLPSEIVAAFLLAQLENLDRIQNQRKKIWQRYFESLLPLQDWALLKLPLIADYASNNAHMFYVICRNEMERADIIASLRRSGIYPVFHYLSLHASEFYQDKHDGRALPMSDHFSQCLLRLPFYFELTEEDQKKVVGELFAFFEARK